MTYTASIHHRRSIRLQNYDYTANGAYFVTFRTVQKECLFGTILHGTLQLNDFGLAVAESWIAIPNHFPGVELDEYVVMPNHFHGILNLLAIPVGAKQGSSASPDSGNILEKQATRQIQGEALTLVQPHGTTCGSLGAIIQNFKSVSTRSGNRMRNKPGCSVWQRNYYERVIRNERELSTVREYIVNNPMKWALDKDNPANSV
jgi:putative transposase